MTTERPRVVVITGPTATGKSRTAIEAAHELAGRGRAALIVSMDSMQVYRYMDVGTDKLTMDEREDVPHHLIDVVDPDDTFSAAQFAEAAGRIITDAWESGGAAILAGGTGFYLRALREGLFQGPAADPGTRERLTREIEQRGLPVVYERLRELDPEYAARIHPNDRVRTIRALEVYELTGSPISAHFEKQGKGGAPFDFLVIGLTMDRGRMYEKIDSRAGDMLERGLVDEVRRLRKMGYSRELASQQALGYKQAHQLLDGEIDVERAAYLIRRDTRHYARRQLTWLRKEKGLEWMDAADPGRIIRKAVEFVEGAG